MTILDLDRRIANARLGQWLALFLGGAALTSAGCDASPDDVAASPSALHRADLGAVGGYAVGHTDTVLHDGDRAVAVDVWYPVDAETVAADAPEAIYPLDPYFGYLPVSTSSDWEPYGIDRAYQGVSPAAEGGFPLVIFSPGWAMPENSYIYVGARLASHGFVVAAIAHWGEGWWPWEPWDTDSVVLTNRPRDVSFVIDELVARSAEPGDLLESAIDPDRIAAGGHSYGGYTALVLASGDDVVCDSRFLWDYGSPDSSCVRTDPDPRIKAVFAFDGSGQILRFEELQRVSVPFISINEDPSLTAYDADWQAGNARMHVAIPGPASFRVDISPATHLAFSSWCETAYVYLEMGIYSQGDFDGLSYWGCDEELAPWTDLHRVATKYTLAFLHTYLGDHPGYNRELTPGHAGNEPMVELWRGDDCSEEADLPAGSPYFQYGVDRDSGCIQADKNPAQFF